MKLLVTTAILHLLALIGGTTADRPSEQCLSAPDLCLHNGNASNTFARLKKPVIRANTPQPDDNEAWIAARCRGERLLHAMKLTDQDETSKMLQWPYTESPWDGDLKTQLETWGYSEEEKPDTCDFEYAQFDRAFEALGIDTSAVQEGGRNTCYRFRHYNGPKVERNEDGKLPDKYIQKYKVDGKTYRTTGAFAEIGVNPQDGAVYFFSRESPEHSAELHWKDKRPIPDDLPKLRSSSDLTWGLWNRAAVPRYDIKHIKYFIVFNAANTVTKNTIVPRALKPKNLASDGTKPWPGSGFRMDAEGEEGEAARALLGSANGIAVAYFLLQHKNQLGASRFVWKVRVFLSDDEDDLPDNYNLLFFVDGTPDPAGGSDGHAQVQADAVETKVQSIVVKRSVDGKSFVREHIFQAKL